MTRRQALLVALISLLGIVALFMIWAPFNPTQNIAFAIFNGIVGSILVYAFLLKQSESAKKVKTFFGAQTAKQELVSYLLLYTLGSAVCFWLFPLYIRNFLGNEAGWWVALVFSGLITVFGYGVSFQKYQDRLAEEKSADEGGEEK